MNQKRRALRLTALAAGLALTVLSGCDQEGQPEPGNTEPHELSDARDQLRKPLSNDAKPEIVKPVPISDVQKKQLLVSRENVEQRKKLERAKLKQEELVPAKKPDSMEPMSLDQQVEAAVADLVSRTGTARDEVIVNQASVVNWSTSALGCPKPDMNYMQVITPGVMILLEAGGKIHRYHGASKRMPFLCPNELAESPAQGQGAEFM